MNSREKRMMIHQKLEIMKRCYQERDPENFDLFFDAFFDGNRMPVIIGTDNGPWFHSIGQIRWLISYDWEKWGDLEIDSWNFSIFEADSHDVVRARALLDFHEDRVWDLDIVMIFSKMGVKYSCRLMQFKIPRNEIRPVVILNRSQKEQVRSEKEMKDLITLNGNVSGDLMREHLAQSVRAMLREEKPYLEDIDVREEMIYMEESEDGYLFALTGFCVHSELNALLPFRMVGIGQVYGILDVEFSYPFASSLG